MLNALKVPALSSYDTRRRFSPPRLTLHCELVRSVERPPRHHNVAYGALWVWKVALLQYYHDFSDVPIPEVHLHGRLRLRLATTPFILLWYTIFSTKIEGLGFEINPYDIYVSNKMIEGTQLTIAWYTDDKTFLHRNPVLIPDTINKVKKHFGDIYTVKRNKHTDLWINMR